MAGVLKRTANSATVQIVGSDSYREWQLITVGGSVLFKWKIVLYSESSRAFNIKISKKSWSDKLNYIVTYIHWDVMAEMGRTEMRVRADDVGAVYCPGILRKDDERVVTVEISLDQLSPYATIYDDAELTDFMLRGEDGSVPFHKVVLAAHSSVFKTMLAGKWKETSEGVIDVPSTSKEMLQHLKRYMYLGNLPEKQNEQVDCIKQLFVLSSCYIIENLTLRCIKELRFLLTIENVYDMMQFAMESKNKQLFVEIMDCAVNGDINLIEVQKLVEAENATLM